MDTKDAKNVPVRLKKKIREKATSTGNLLLIATQLASPVGATNSQLYLCQIKTTTIAPQYMLLLNNSRYKILKETSA